MATRRRDRVQIYADILQAICLECKRDREVKVTRVQYRVGVPFDRFKGYVGELSELGLIKAGGALVLTDRGRNSSQAGTRFLKP